ncbi:hypothetical protein NPX13_g8762 [Xylaria arbuscula]|uniref:Uncharacterized protein n=1 Tax=Xylaria arbuscula TaxID=114810 RepID=A0A9W8TJU8_9PEZI|nr:hypothetical protein NPX13_g8762 [Xylaria arbuscula]
MLVWLSLLILAWGIMIYRLRKQAQANKSDPELTAVPPADVPLEDILRGRSQTTRTSAASWPQTVESSNPGEGSRASRWNRFTQKIGTIFKKEETDSASS